MAIQLEEVMETTLATNNSTNIQNNTNAAGQASQGQLLYRQTRLSTQPDQTVREQLERTAPDQKSRLATQFVEAAGRQGVAELSSSPEGQHALARIYDLADKESQTLMKQIHNKQGNTAVDYTRKGSDNETPTGAIAGALTGGPAIYTYTDALTRAKLTEYANELRNLIQSGELSKRKAGTVGAVVVDNLIRKAYTGHNHKGIPDNLHPVIQSLKDNMNPGRMHDSLPATHAEVYVLNDALWARESINQEKGISSPLTKADLSTFTLDTFWTKDSTMGTGMVQGETAHRCANCTQLSDGVRNLAGDSPGNYSTEQAARRNIQPDQVDTPPRGPYTTQDLHSARRGGLIGGGLGFGISSLQAMADGRITAGEAQGIATDTGIAATTGALGEVIENQVARAIAQPGTTSVTGATARTVAGRFAGAGVAGAIISSGFSAFEQVNAFQRGDVSGSEAIGNVVGEAAVGASAGLAGAAAGAAIGSVIPLAGTVVGGVVGLGVGLVAGYLTDRGLHAAGVNTAIASGVTTAIDAGADLIDDVSSTLSNAGQSLASAFGW